MPPNFLYSFTDASGLPNTTFGSEMGVTNGTDWGKKLMRDQYNSQQYGPLFDIANDGIAAGTDLYFAKSKELSKQKRRNMSNNRISTYARR